MELAIPLLAMGGLFVVSKQSKNKENYQGYEGALPNVDIPDKNYPHGFLVQNAETDLTSKLATVNKYDTPHVYTDKYFNAQTNTKETNTYAPLGEAPVSNTSGTYRSLTGETVDQNYFRHNNMVPFFRGSVRSRGASANSNEQLLDSYSGTGSQIITKKEQAPLFKPSENYQWANGAPNTTDFERSRMNPSMRMHNVKPFEEQRVGPGLGLGYTTDGVGGFNSGLLGRDEWREKTVDELRVLTNPKASAYTILGHEGPANSYIKKRGEGGIQERHGVDGSFEVGQERYLTTTGLEKGPTQRSIQVERFVSRPETTAEYAGVAGYGTSTTYSNGEYMPTSRIALESYPVTAAYASGMGSATESDYGVKSNLAYPNNRSENRQDNYFGAIGGTIGAVVAPLLDALRPSRKENTIGNLRPYQNAKSEVNASYMYDPNDKPLPTTRETTERNKFLGGAQTNQRGGAYEVTTNQPVNTTRYETSDYMYVGNSSAGDRARDMRSYEAEYNQRNNDIKSSTIDGRLVQGNMNIYNGNIVMENSTRDSYLLNKRPLAQQGTAQMPSVNNMGRFDAATPLYQTIQTDRTNPEILSALNKNPFAIPYNYYGKQG